MVLYISLITETSSSCRKNNCYVPFLEYKHFRNEAEQLFLKPAETCSCGTLCFIVNKSFFVSEHFFVKVFFVRILKIPSFSFP